MASNPESPGGAVTDSFAGETVVVLKTGVRRSQEWVRHAISLLDAAASQLQQEQAAHCTILKAASLLRQAM